MTRLFEVLAAFDLDSSSNVVPFGSGLINNTWHVTFKENEYILQRINKNVFHHPEDIAHNILLIGNHLSEHHPEYLFTCPVKTTGGGTLYISAQQGYFRLFPFVKDSHTIDVVQNADQAYTAAAEFGKFTSLLDGFPATELKITIPDFHNLSLRYATFLKALKEGIPERAEKAKDAIQYILSQDRIVKKYNEIIGNQEFRTRVTHNDTKISNVLFDEEGKGLCVIDLDTVMPGYFISDVGDMMRTYLCPVSEEETDFGKIGIREDFYTAIVNGYSDQMKDHLTGAEKKYFMYAGQFMIYMQAIRFLTDYLYDDIYYGSKYPGHNFVRAKNQLELYRRLSEHRHLEKLIC